MFTQNQIRQMFVVKTVGDTLQTKNYGDLAIKTTLTPEGEYMLQYVDSTKKVVTLLIPAQNILWKRLTPASKQAYHSKANFVTLVDPDGSGTGYSGTNLVVPGQDYMLNIRINGLYWDSDEVWGHKYGVVHGATGMTNSVFYKKMAKSLAANFLREPAPMLKFYVTTATSAAGVVFEGNQKNVTEVTANTDLDNLVGTYTGLVIDEVEQPWRLGVMPQHGVDYIVSTANIYVDNEEIAWGEVETFVGNLTVANSKKVADMEWHYHGERGDINRESAWPLNYPNVGLVNPDNENGYDLVDIHYYWIGNNHAIQRSEKDITLVFDAENDLVQTFMSKWNAVGDEDFMSFGIVSEDDEGEEGDEGDEGDEVLY